jgi:DUF1365 family protein
VNSALYVGRVRHRRMEAPAGAFEYRLFMVWLDLAELDSVFRGRWLWSTRRPALARFRREDYFGDPARPLDLAVRDRVEAETGRRPAGPIRMLTHLRYFGFVFNPVTFYYCFAADGRAVEAVVADITNTPWNERHAYVVGVPSERADPLRTSARFRKAFHVSPFLSMDYDYDWSFHGAQEELTVHMENWRDGERRFDATLTLERREIGGASLAAALLRHPFMTAKVVAAIYWQALLLWLRRATFFPHPRRQAG